MSIWLLCTMIALISAIHLREKIGQLIMESFIGDQATIESDISQDIIQRKVGGAIIFSSTMHGNVKGPDQLHNLTSTLKQISMQHTNYSFLFSVDEEGGQIARLRKRNGFIDTESAAAIGKVDNYDYTQSCGRIIGEMLWESRLDINFAPVVDILTYDLNPELGKYERCFGVDPYKVGNHSMQYILGMQDYNVMPTMKHFPGKGSERNDTEVMFSNITDYWTENDLISFRNLVHIANLTMTSHLTVSQLDSKYQTTFSRKIVTDLLQNTLKFDRAITTDDINMGSVHKYYTFEEAVVMALRAGHDILLICNHMDSGFDPLLATRAIDAVERAVKNGIVSIEQVEKSFAKIQELKKGAI